MLEFLAYSLVWIFAIYGLIEIIKTIYLSLVKVPDISGGKIHILIGVKDCEEYIEPFIRTLFLKTFENIEFANSNIIIVDMNSKDKTEEILEKLNEKYQFELKKITD